MSLLKDALAGAAADARVRGLRPEELVIALKSLEVRVHGPDSQNDPARSTARLKMVQALLEVYFQS